MMNINSHLIYVLASIVTSIVLIYTKVTPTLWGALIHETVVEQMAGAGLAEILVFGFADVIGAVSIMGGGGFVFVTWTVVLVQRLVRE